MKKCIAACLLIICLLTGCATDEAAETTSELNYDAFTVSEHIDHHAAQNRKARNFFLENVSGELSVLYLSYNEPDGCVTRVCEVGSDPGWEQREPQLFQQGDAFYYTLIDSVNSSAVESDGYLYRIDFVGNKTSLQVPEGKTMGHIVRTDEGGIYCTANDGETYLRTDLLLTDWEEIAMEDAEK